MEEELFWKNKTANDLDGEIWKPIPNYEGYYAASNLGRIKALERRVIANTKGHYKCLKEKILSQCISGDGYLIVSCCKNAKHTCEKVAILIAKSLIPNPENKPEVNHKNGNKLDNRNTNLEWNTKSENMKHAYSVLNNKSVNKGKLRGAASYSKLVFCFENKTVYLSILDAAADLNIDNSSISKVCLGKTKAVKGYTFSFILSVK